MVSTKRLYFYLAWLAVSLLTSTFAIAVCEDFEIEGTYEGAIDLPKIYFLLKHTPDGEPLTFDGEFAVNYAFLDTGASGILLSRETAEGMGVTIDANGQFVDTGIAGDEFFNVSEPLYIGVADFNAEDPEDFDIYRLNGKWNFQVSREYAEDTLLGEPIDVIGIPVMAGKTVVLRPVRDFGFFDDNDFGFSSAASYDEWDDWGDDWGGDDWGIPFFSADIKDPNDSNIPQTDFQVALRFEKFISPSNPLNSAPLPVLAYNPVIDNITVERDGLSSKGNWLFDTGGMISVISYEQAITLGLMDEEGEPLVEPDFYVPIGGVGGAVDLAGFTLDKLSVPTLSGFNLVYINARVCVTDIAVWDEDLGDFVAIDGVFGDNFICASVSMDTSGTGDVMDFNISSTPFDYIVIDTQKGLLGFDVAPEYPLPSCHFSDLDSRCGVDEGDLAVFASNWLLTGCGSGNDFCDGADIDKNGSVNFSDFHLLAGDWLKQDCQYPCGCEKRPYPAADFTHDCRVDFDDLAVFMEEWLKPCDWLNFNCRNADLYRDGTVNYRDFSVFSDNW